MESVLTQSGLELYHSKFKEYIYEQIKQANNISKYPSSLHFPTIGEENMIYISENENKTYRWDDENLKYYCIGSDYNDINLIMCGDSTT